MSDFRLPDIQIEELKKGLRNSGSLRAEQNIPDMHYSLRVSMSEYVTCVIVFMNKSPESHHTKIQNVPSSSFFTEEYIRMLDVPPAIARNTSGHL